MEDFTPLELSSFIKNQLLLKGFNSPGIDSEVSNTDSVLLQNWARGYKNHAEFS